MTLYNYLFSKNVIYHKFYVYLTIRNIKLGIKFFSSIFMFTLFNLEACKKSLA